MNDKHLRLALGVLLAFFSACDQAKTPTTPAAQTLTTPAAGAIDIDRTHLPVAEPTPPTYTELDARYAKPL